MHQYPVSPRHRRHSLFFLYFSLFTLNFSLFSFHSSLSQTPDWIWARCGTHPAQNGADGRSIAVDNANNVFFTGWFYDSITFGSTLLTGNVSVFLTKYD